MLTGTSTRADAVAQFRANLLYETDATGAKARALIEACRYLVATPSRSKHPNAFETEYDLGRLAELERTANAWLATLTAPQTGQVPGSSLPRQFSFERFGR